MRRQSGNVELGLIFDYDSCNDYAKLIIDILSVWVYKETEENL